MKKCTVFDIYPSVYLSISIYICLSICEKNVTIRYEVLYWYGDSQPLCIFVFSSLLKMPRHGVLLFTVSFPCTSLLVQVCCCWLGRQLMQSVLLQLATSLTKPQAVAATARGKHGIWLVSPRNCLMEPSFRFQFHWVGRNPQGLIQGTVSLLQCPQGVKMTTKRKTTRLQKSNMLRISQIQTQTGLLTCSLRWVCIEDPAQHSSQHLSTRQMNPCLNPLFLCSFFDIIILVIISN